MCSRLLLVIISLNWSSIWYQLMKFLKIISNTHTKRLLWIPAATTIVGYIAISFPIIQKKHPISILCQIPESALGIVRHRKTLLNRLTFCFSFSLKHLLCLLCSLWMLQQLWCPYVTNHPQARACPGQSHCNKYHFYADGTVGLQAFLFRAPLRQWVSNCLEELKINCSRRLIEYLSWDYVS